MFSILLVGYGGIGQLWARVLMSHPRVALCGVVDTSDAALRRAKSELGSPHLTVTTDIDVAVTSCAPAAIVDASPPWNHAGTAQIARAARCHLLSEKPLSTDFQEARHRVEDWRSSGLVYMVNQNQRWNPLARDLRRWIEQGGLGAVKGIYVDYFHDFHKGTFRDYLPHALLLDMAVHHFDLVRFISRLDPVSVSCWELSSLAAVATFQLTDGVVFSYRGSWDTIGQDTGWGGLWRVVGDRGSVTWPGQAQATAWTSDGESSSRRFVLSGSDPRYTEATALEYELMKSLDHFVECLSTGAEPETSCYDNLHTLGMVVGAIRAAEEERSVEVNRL